MSQRIAPEVTDSPVPVGASLVADPAPLGLAAFALTTFLLSLSNALIWPAADAAIACAIAYGGTVQLLAGMWEFRRGNTFGAVAFSSYGGFWISFFFLTFVLRVADNQSVGAYLAAWGIFTLYMTVSSLRVSAAVFVVFALLTLTYALLAWGAFESAPTINQAGGAAGIATAVAAWYASFAGVTNETFKRAVLPTGNMARFFDRVSPPAV